MNLETILSSKTTLSELGKAFPEQWQEVRPTVIPVIERHDPQEMEAYLRQVEKQSRHWQRRTQQSRLNPKVMETAIPKIVRARMGRLALQTYFDAVLEKDQTPRGFRRIWDAFLLRFILPIESLSQLNCSMRSMNRTWKWIKHKNHALGRLKKSGQYTVYSKEFVESVSRELADEECLEVAAGAGTLTTKLRTAHTNVRAVDDASWNHVVHVGTHVENMSAEDALDTFAGSTVLCAWPPPKNAFEQHIFRNRHVTRYLVIGSQMKSATGNRQVYQHQKSFSCERRTDLEALLFPVEHAYEVLEFKRRT